MNTERGPFKPLLAGLLTMAAVSSLMWAQDCVLGVIPVGVGPSAVAIDPAANEAFVLHQGSREVMVLDLNSRAVKGKYEVGGRPEGIAFNQKTRALVIAGLTGKVTTIDHASGRIIATLDVGKAPSRIAINADKNIALVTDFYGAKLFVIDLAAQKITDTIPLKKGALGIALLEGGNRAVVACQYDMELLQVNLESKIVDKDLLVGRYLSELAVNPATGRVVFVNPSSSGVITVVIPGENVILSTLSLGAGPLSVAVYAKRNVALVGEYNANTVSLVDLEKSSVLRTMRVAKGPAGLAIHPDTGVAVIANKLANSVTFLDLEAMLKTAAPPASAPETKPAAPGTPASLTPRVKNGTS